MVFRNCLGMIMSVSTLIIGSGAATPRSVVNFSMAGPSDPWDSGGIWPSQPQCKPRFMSCRRRADKTRRRCGRASRLFGGRREDDDETGAAPMSIGHPDLGAMGGDD